MPIVGMLMAAVADPMIRDSNGNSVEDWAKIHMDDGLPEVLDLIQRWFTAHSPRTLPP